MLCKYILAFRLFATFCSVVLTCLFARIAFADIAPHPIHGGVALSTFGGNSDEISMEEEVVKIRVNDKACHVHVVFKMRNLTNKPVKMQIGFPAHYDADLVDFVAWSNGKRLTHLENKTVYPKRDDEHRAKGRKWQVWQQLFEPSTFTEIAVQYSNKHNKEDNNNSWNMDSSQFIHEAVSKFHKPEEKSKAIEQFEYFPVEYILRSGAGWAGDIGKCRVEMSLEGFTAENLLPECFKEPEHWIMPLDWERPEETSAKITPTGLVWDVNNLEPKSDIRLLFTPRITRQATRELLERLHVEHPENADIAMLLAGYLRFENKLEQRDIVIERLLHASQDKIALYGPEATNIEVYHQSQGVLKLIRLLTSEKPYRTYLPTQSPERTARLIYPLAMSLQEQLKLAPPKADNLEYIQSTIESSIVWCKQQPNWDSTEPLVIAEYILPEVKPQVSVASPVNVLNFLLLTAIGIFFSVFLRLTGMEHYSHTPQNL